MKLVYTQPAVLRVVTALAVSVICFFVASGAGLPNQDLSSKKAGVQSEQETRGTPKSDGAEQEPDLEDSANTNKVSDSAPDNAPKSVGEARIRARILHEAFSGALQVMHRDFFREDQKLKLPSKSLEDVFSEMATKHNIQLHWIAVNATAMSVEHQPKTDFEKAVVLALSADKDEFESVSDGLFQYAGAIELSASCLKCHARSRTSNDPRKAALTITIPLLEK